MDLQEAINKFYYNMTLNELKLMNDNTLYPNITYNSLLYLDLIACKDHCTVSYLSEVLNISKPAVTLKINELIKQGLVKKTQSQKDKRIYYISVTPAVADDYKDYDRKLLKTVRNLSGKYTESELKLFTDILETVQDCYQD